LVAAINEDVPGVTQVDLTALRGDPIVAPPKRSLLGFISGEYQVEEPAAPHESLAPPPDEVRREMLRMEIEAAEAEAAAIRAELEIEAAEAAEDAEAEREGEAGTEGEGDEAKVASETASPEDDDSRS
jgi:hypothetical protein